MTDVKSFVTLVTWTAMCLFKRWRFGEKVARRLERVEPLERRQRKNPRLTFWRRIFFFLDLRRRRLERNGRLSSALYNFFIRNLPSG